MGAGRDKDCNNNHSTTSWLLKQAQPQTVAIPVSHVDWGASATSILEVALLKHILFPQVEGDLAPVQSSSNVSHNGSIPKPHPAVPSSYYC